MDIGLEDSFNPGLARYNITGISGRELKILQELNVGGEMKSEKRTAFLEGN
jgi:hypothetical protein